MKTKRFEYKTWNSKGSSMLDGQVAELAHEVNWDPSGWLCPSLWATQELCFWFCTHWSQIYSNKFTAVNFEFILQFVVALWRCSQTRKIKSEAEGFGKISVCKPERQFSFLICIHIWTSDKAWADRTGFLNPLRLVDRVLWFRLIPEWLLR